MQSTTNTSLPTSLSAILREYEAATDVVADVACQGLETGLDDEADWEELLVEIVTDQLGAPPTVQLRMKAQEVAAFADDIRADVEAGQTVSVWDAYGRIACVVSS